MEEGAVPHRHPLRRTLRPVDVREAAGELDFSGKVEMGREQQQSRGLVRGRREGPEARLERRDSLAVRHEPPQPGADRLHRYTCLHSPTPGADISPLHGRCVNIYGHG